MDREGGGGADQSSVFALKSKSSLQRGNKICGAKKRKRKTSGGGDIFCHDNWPTF